MKMRLLLALAGLTISFALPTIAQEKEEVNPKILAGIQANDKAYDDAFNKHDCRRSIQNQPVGVELKPATFFPLNRS